jgi:hypothetical protein
VWSYEPAADESERLLRILDGVTNRLRRLGGTPLGALYGARANELHLELEAALAVGTPMFAARARARFGSGPERDQADALASTWCAERDDAEESRRLASDDRDPRSLVSRMRAEVARRHLTFAVRTSPSLTALAAISGDTVWVAEGRELTALDVERTVVHEIEAHALPRSRARTLPVPLFAIGTAGGSDDQEGYALWLEERRGVSGPSRRRELGARHLAVSLMSEGADFVSVVRTLRAESVPLDTCLRAAGRAFRGSHGKTPGLGRERVYIEAFLRVDARLARAPDDEAVLHAGQVAVTAIDTLRPWARA